MLKKLLAKLFHREASKIRDIKSALELAKGIRDPNDRFATIIMDYPLLVDLAKAYIEAKDWDSAQEIVRTCFALRDEYHLWGGNREAFLIERLATEFSKNGREDIAKHIATKVKNFEAGIPPQMLSTVSNLEEMGLTKVIEQIKRDREKERNR